MEDRSSFKRRNKGVNTERKDKKEQGGGDTLAILSLVLGTLHENRSNVSYMHEAIEMQHLITYNRGLDARGREMALGKINGKRE